MRCQSSKPKLIAGVNSRMGEVVEEDLLLERIEVIGALYQV